MKPLQATQILPYLSVLIFAASPFTSGAEDGTAHGTVYNDLNGNGVRDEGEPGLPGVYVSNQREVVATDEDGRWSLPHDDDTIFFVIKPTGWKTRFSEHLVPRFYYSHKPKGSPTNLKYPGVAPTGPLPESIDFPLQEQDEPEKFHAIFFGDPQPTNQTEIDYIANDTIAELVGTDARFGVTLGDIMNNDLSLFESNNATMALVGIPWYYVIGNHDLNFEPENDEDSDETFQRVYGPNYYAFNYGNVHFIALDDVKWGTKRPNGSMTYTGGLSEEQIDFVRNDLATVPEEQLVVLMMHIPIYGIEDRAELYRIIEKRPYSLSISGHTHWQGHFFLDEKDGWQGDQPHHHIVNVTVCGTWWKGQKDELGIPHATMRDGAPNGYSIIHFDGHKTTFDFKAARQPASYQMNISAPDEVTVSTAPEQTIYVNVFSGSERSTVRFQVGEEGEWISMEKTLEMDPYYVAVRDREIAQDPTNTRPLNSPTESNHLWKAALPAGLSPGVTFIHAETTDMYGRTFETRRQIRITAD